jgi:hypothetical protein
VGTGGEETLGAGDAGEGDFTEGVGAEVGALVGAGDEGDRAFRVGALATDGVGAGGAKTSDKRRMLHIQAP